MGHVFQSEYHEKNYGGNHFWFIDGDGNWKMNWKRKCSINLHFIYEIK